ncbi:MAG: GNAT family N-acetyltransferase [Gammaproteobacteria bacterium]|nr:GNAT family N-acetyltransferase [Gammaproteobacteria bacterium]
MAIILETDRLILRTWKEEDAAAYFKINQDPKVIACLCGSLKMAEVNAFIVKMNHQQEERGYTLWATELKANGEMMGFIGLNYTDWPAHFTPAVEVGWRLGSQYWGQGYATEGAKASLAHGFTNCGLEEVVSLTVPANVRSIRVMEKIGLARDMNGDFIHPQLPAGHRLAQHILYRLTKDKYLEGDMHGRVEHSGA